MSIFSTLFGNNVQNSTSSTAGGGGSVPMVVGQGVLNSSLSSAPTSQYPLNKAAAQANAAQQMAMNGYNQQMNALMQSAGIANSGGYTVLAVQAGGVGGSWQSRQQSVTSGVYAQPDAYPNYTTRENLEADPLAMADISVLADLWRARFGDDWVGSERLEMYSYEKEETRDFKTIYNRLSACRKLECVNTQDKGSLWRIIS